MSRRRVAILISGRGSNMEALIRAAEAPDYPAEIALVLSNRADAGGLATAASAGIEARAIPGRDFASREAHEAAMAEAVDGAGAEIVCLAGYMRLLTPFFVDRYARRMINIHPSLLPLFPGLDTHARALTSGMRIHGCTVHQVTQAMDEGPIIAQGAITVRDGDTPETLAERLLAVEHRLYPLALRRLIEGGGAPDDAMLLG